MVNQLIKGSIMLVIIFAIALFAAFIYAYNEIQLDMDKIINYSPKTSSVILDYKGNKIANIMEGQHRLYAKYDEMPGYLIEALIAIEDTRFFEHNGVNPDAIIRAALRNFKAGKKVEGGSTITQQLVKKILLSPKKSYTRKLKEAILSMKVEDELTKEQILERYLNEISFGRGYFGVKTAAKGFFHKDLENLTLKEAALLIGLPNAPSYFNPVRHLDRALKRANTILTRMRNLGWIKEDEYLIAIKETPEIYHGSLTQNIAPYVADEVVRRLKNDFPNIKTGGYTIYTTIDMKEQKIARKALKFAVRKATKRYRENMKTTTLNGALLAVDNKTGDIKAMVGGVERDVWIAKSRSYTNWLILRGFLVDGKPDAAAKMWKDGLKIYPLKDANNSKKMVFTSGSGKEFNTIHANNFEFYNELAAVINKEPVDFIDPELRGLAAAIGIIKGEPFAPDAGMKKILVDAVAVGNATARSIGLSPRDKNAYLYKGKQWYTGFVGKDYRWLDGDGHRGRNLDARTLFFYTATVNTPAMALEIPGVGSNYAFCTKDSKKDILYGVNL